MQSSQPKEQTVGVKRSGVLNENNVVKKATLTGSKTTSKLIVYEAPQPVKELPRLLKDVIPSLRGLISARPPFLMEPNKRLTVPAALLDKFPVIDRLFRLRGGKQGQRKQIEHDTENNEPISLVDDDSIVEVQAKEYYYENIDVRNDLILEAEALLSSLTKSQVSFITDTIVY
jgi:hypothetical protein